MERKDKFVKCIHMDIRTFIKFIEDYLAEVDKNLEFIINRVDKMNNFTVSCNVITREINPITKNLESFGIFNFQFIDDSELEKHPAYDDSKFTHFAYIDTITGPSINISEAWNNFLKNQSQKQSQPTEAQPE